MFDSKTVYLNGQYLALADAKVSVLDRGFLFGDGVYEVIPVYGGRLFHFQEHLQRLENSLDLIRLANPHTREAWHGILASLIDSSQNQYIYLQITRGVGLKRDHAFPEQTQPTVFAMAATMTRFVGCDTGISAMTMDDSRWKLCHAKTITLLANILHRQSALDQGGAEAILIRDGFLTEGAASNVFIVVDGVLLTPPKSPDILPGITRDVLLDVAKANHVACCEEAITFDQLQSADEIWVTSSIREIVPVIELDGQTISGGKPGPIFKKVDQFFQTYKQTLA